MVYSLSPLDIDVEPSCTLGCWGGGWLTACSVPKSTRPNNNFNDNNFANFSLLKNLNVFMPAFVNIYSSLTAL